jgi:hypothetical protein
MNGYAVAADEETDVILKSRGEPILSAQALLKILSNRTLMVTYVSQQPYTYVRVQTYFNGKVYDAHGFAKVSGTDKFDEQYGIGLAATHALRRVSRLIRKGG